VIDLTDDQTIIDAFTTGMVASCDRGNEVLDNDETDFYGKPVAVVQSPTFLDSPDDYDAENGTEDAGGVEIDGSVDTTTSKPINPAVRIPNADVRKWHVALEKLSDSVKKKVIESFWEHYPEPLAARWARAADEERSEILNRCLISSLCVNWYGSWVSLIH
jgi:hypothetical protein